MRVKNPDNPDFLGDFAARLQNAAGDHTQTEIAEHLGIRISHVNNWFTARHFPRANFRAKLAAFLKVRAEWLYRGEGTPTEYSGGSEAYDAVAQHGVFTREVPVISWAHAGAAAAYDEMPKHFHGSVHTSSRDPRAFAVTVEGDSMEPKVYAGDRVICEPSNPPINGKPVVAKHVNEGVQLRLYYRLPTEKIRLSPANPVYSPFEYDADAFIWIYPVIEMSRRF